MKPSESFEGPNSSLRKAFDDACRKVQKKCTCKRCKDYHVKVVKKDMKTYKCKKCGSTDFWLDESIGWKCYVDEENNLNCKLANNDINGIFCSHCGEEVKKGLEAFNGWIY